MGKSKALKAGQVKKLKQGVAGFPVIQFVFNGFSAGASARKNVSQQFSQSMTVSERAHDGSNRVRSRKS